MIRKRRLEHVMILIFSAAFWGGHAFAQDDLPQTTDDGLELIDSRFRALYWQPGESLEPYRRIVILDCFVEFREDWLRDQNRGRKSFNRVTPEKMEQIKEILADEFLEVVTEVLTQDGAYEIVNETAEDVLVLRPAILNVDVGADIFGSASQIPDTSSRTAMTLFLEFYDSATSTLIGRALDARTEPGVSRAAAGRIFRRWADTMRITLDEGLNRSQ